MTATLDHAESDTIVSAGLPWIAPETGYEPWPQRRPAWRQIIAQNLAELQASGSLQGTFLDGPGVNDALTVEVWPGRGFCLHCWGKLGNRRRSYCSAECRRAYERETRRTDTEAFAGMVARVIERFGLRVAANDLTGFTGDLDGLAALADVVAVAESALSAAVAGLREHGYSWTDIGAALGITRQAAQQRWGQR